MLILSDMHILVTGGAGYIGSACVASLIKEGHKVVIFDDFSTGQADKIPHGTELVQGSLLDSEAINRVCAVNKFAAVFHFAAKKAVGESEVNPVFYFETNVVGTFNLLKAMDQYHIPKIIFSSTAAVYESPKDNSLISENSPLGPISVYGTSKHIVEEMIEDFTRTGAIKNNVILRYFNVAGDAGLGFKEKNPQNVFPIIANKLKEDIPFQIFGCDYDTKDGTCVRDYIHLRDLVNAHILALNSTESGIYNLGTGTGYTVRDLVGAFNRNTDKQLMVEEYLRRPGDASVVVADASLARAKLGWSPHFSLDDMVKDTLKVYL